MESEPRDARIDLAAARVRHARAADVNEYARLAAQLGSAIGPRLEAIAVDDSTAMLGQLCAIKAIAMMLGGKRTAVLARIERRWALERPVVAKACRQGLAAYLRDWDPVQLEVAARPSRLVRLPRSLTSSRVTSLGTLPRRSSVSPPSAPIPQPRTTPRPVKDAASGRCIHGYPPYNCRVCAGKGRFRRTRYQP